MITQSIAVIRKLTGSQERHDLFMGALMPDCCQLEVDDVDVPQPILHHSFVYLPFNLRTENVALEEDAGCISVDRKAYYQCFLRSVRSISLNFQAVL